MVNTYFIPIQSMNLAHYLGSGIIAPANYFENRNKDIQDRFNNYLLLSTSKYTIETNCCIEIVLNKSEEAPLRISENFFLFDMPIPISRIKNIYFNDEKQKINTIFDIASGTAFIPNKIIKTTKENSVNTSELDNVSYKPSEINWNSYLKKYDQVLGGVSSMKISKEEFQNYPTHYFSTLGNINKLFKNILENQNITIENNFEFAFTDKGNFKEFHDTIYSEINIDVVKKFASINKIKLEEKNGLIQIDNIPENKTTYFVAILETYGNDKRKKIDSFVSDLISGKFIENKKEGLSLIFGLNKGYKAFRNKYKTSNFEVDIKFKLNSKLDYYIIESVYQNVFNSIDNNVSFKYIDDLFLESSLNDVQNSNYFTYQVLDELIIWKPKIKSPIEILMNKITDKISKWFPNFIEVKKKEIELIFKEDFIEFQVSIQKELGDKYNNEIENLKKIIEEKDKIITEFQNKIESNIPFATEIKKEKTDNKQNINYENLNNSSNENYVNEEIVTLFSDEIEFSDYQYSELDLKKKSLNNLKELANLCKIKVPSKINKGELINLILNYNSKK